MNRAAENHQEAAGGLEEPAARRHIRGAEPGHRQGQETAQDRPDAGDHEGRDGWDDEFGYQGEVEMPVAYDLGKPAPRRDEPRPVRLTAGRAPTEVGRRAGDDRK